MPQETVGYVELEWTCPSCGTKNPGLQKKCKGCGAAMPESARFAAPENAELLQDKGKLEAAQKGPDIHCGYCGARNPAGAVKCVNCGADLSAGKARQVGEVVGALGPAVAAAPAPALAAKPAGTGMKIGCLLIVGLVVLGVIIFAALGARTSDTIGVVQGVQWQRTVAVLGLAPVTHQAWRNEVPQGSQVGQCSRKPLRVQDEPAAGADKICGTPYIIDQGSGAGKVVQDCKYQVYDDYCDYTVQEWTVVDRAVAQGTDLDPNWPTVSVSNGRRAGDRSETYQVTFTANDRTYNYAPASLKDYARFRPGSKWTLKINTFGQITGVQPAG